MHKVPALTRLVLLVSAFLLTTTAAPAATLYGKVESVEEGDVLTVFNLNRSIKIKLLGIDAPEKDQPLAEVSRLHLADLVLNKFVVVHYTGLGQNKPLDVVYQRNVKMGSLGGRQYQLSVPGLGGVMRVFSSDSGNERQLYVLCVLNGTEDQASVKEFFSSLLVNQ